MEGVPAENVKKAPKKKAVATKKKVKSTDKDVKKADADKKVAADKDMEMDDELDEIDELGDDVPDSKELYDKADPAKKDSYINKIPDDPAKYHDFMKKEVDEF